MSTPVYNQKKAEFKRIPPSKSTNKNSMNNNKNLENRHVFSLFSLHTETELYHKWRFYASKYVWFFWGKRRFYLVILPWACRPVLCIGFIERSFSSKNKAKIVCFHNLYHLPFYTLPFPLNNLSNSSFAITGKTSRSNFTCSIYSFFIINFLSLLAGQD